MNREHLLREILSDNDLQEYWLDVDIESINYNNLMHSEQNNKYLRAIHYLMSDDGAVRKQN